MTLTDAAKAQIAKLMQRPEAGGKAGVRLTVPAKGCSGLSYKMGFVDAPFPGDEEVDVNGQRLFIDPMATMFILGTEIDYDSKDPLAPGFKFNNPMATGECGCGESFTTQ